MKQEPRGRYPFHFTPLMLICLIVGLILSAAGFVLTLWRFIGFLRDGPNSVYAWIQYILLFFVSIFLAVLVIGMLIRSQYLLTDKQLILQFGFIKQRYELKSIRSVHLFKGLDKLAVYFDDFQSKYAVIVVKDKWYDEFVRKLVELNPDIGFSFSTPEEEEEYKKK